MSACDLATKYHYIVVRNDLPVGHMVAQVAHAAARSGSLHDDKTHVVVLKASFVDLVTLEWRLVSLFGESSYRPFVSVREPDPPYNGALMAIGLQVSFKEEIPSFIKRFPLVE